MYAIIIFTQLLLASCRIALHKRPSCYYISIFYILSLYFHNLLVLKTKEREQSPSGQTAKEQKTPQGTAKGGKGKGKDKADKGDKAKPSGATSRPASVSFDVGKPHWTLRVVNDAPSAVSTQYS